MTIVWPLFRQTTFMCILVRCSTYAHCHGDSYLVVVVLRECCTTQRVRNGCMTHVHTTAMCSAQTTVDNDTHVHAHMHTTHTHTLDGRGWDMHTRVMQQPSPFYLSDQRVGARLLHFVQKLRTIRHKTGRLQSRWETGKSQTNQTSYG